MTDCLLCRHHADTWRDMLDHLRLIHPDTDSQPDYWPDGDLVTTDDLDDDQ